MDIQALLTQKQCTECLDRLFKYELIFRSKIKVIYLSKVLCEKCSLMLILEFKIMKHFSILAQVQDNLMLYDFPKKCFITNTKISHVSDSFYLIWIVNSVSSIRVQFCGPWKIFFPCS